MPPYRERCGWKENGFWRFFNRTNAHSSEFDEIQWFAGFFNSVTFETFNLKRYLKQLSSESNRITKIVLLFKFEIVLFKPASRWSPKAHPSPCVHFQFNYLVDLSWTKFCWIITEDSSFWYSLELVMQATLICSIHFQFIAESALSLSPGEDSLECTATERWGELQFWWTNSNNCSNAAGFSKKGCTVINRFESTPRGWMAKGLFGHSLYIQCTLGIAHQSTSVSS